MERVLGLYIRTEWVSQGGLCPRNFSFVPLLPTKISYMFPCSLQFFFLLCSRASIGKCFVPWKPLGDPQQKNKKLKCTRQGFVTFSHHLALALSLSLDQGAYI